MMLRRRAKPDAGAFPQGAAFGRQNKGFAFTTGRMLKTTAKPRCLSTSWLFLFRPSGDRREVGVLTEHVVRNARVPAFGFFVGGFAQL